MAKERFGFLVVRGKFNDIIAETFSFYNNKRKIQFLARKKQLDLLAAKEKLGIVTVKK